MTQTEDTWTPASDWCPNPERWNARDELATEYEVMDFMFGLVRALQPDYVVETGTYTGEMASRIGVALELNGQGELDTLEIDPDRRRQAEGRCRGLPVHCFYADSAAWTPRRLIDLAWFDSSTDIRWLEFLAMLPWMHDRTVVAFHDTAPQHGDWSDNPRTSSLIRSIELPTPRGLLVGRVLP